MTLLTYVVVVSWLPEDCPPHWEVPVRRPLASSTQHRLPASRPSALGSAVSRSEVSPRPLFLARRQTTEQTETET